ncbi:hypothetical protein WA171_003227 [Blastocystis sp. BT1]
MIVPKHDGYSVVNLMMDMVMVMSIVVFLNVSLRLAPETALIKKITSTASPITRLYERMYYPSVQDRAMKLVSDSGAKQTQIRIGTVAEVKKTTNASSVPYFIRKSVFEVAKAKQLISSATTVENIDVPALIRHSATIKKYYGNNEEAYVPPKGFIHNDAYPYDISLVTVIRISDIDRIVKMSNYWSGPINVCIFAEDYSSSYPTIQYVLSSDAFQSRITLTVVYSDFYNVLFPANMLKNIAISTVFTTHFIEIDSTMLPSSLLYDKLRKIPVTVLYEPINLVTIPVFYTKEEADIGNIRQCLREKKCFPKYLSVMKEWLEPSSASSFMGQMSDLESNSVYYMMRRHNSFDILYDENFLMRGYDDVELVQHLYHEKFVFYLLMDEYFLDYSIRLEVENAVLQKDPEFKAQYEEFLSHIPERESGIEAGSIETDPLLAAYVEYWRKDQEMREKEENELTHLLNTQKNHFDLLTWDRRVTEIVSNRETRRKESY